MRPIPAQPRLPSPVFLSAIVAMVALTSCVPAQPTQLAITTEIPLTPTQSRATTSAPSLPSATPMLNLTPQNSRGWDLEAGEYVVFSRRDAGRDQYGNHLTALYALQLGQSEAKLLRGDISPGARRSPDGKRVALFVPRARVDITRDTPSVIELLDLQTGTTRTSPVSGWGQKLDWSPDGSWLVMARQGNPGVTAGGTLHKIDPATWVTTTILDCPALSGAYSMSYCHEPVSEPNGNRIVYFLSLEDPQGPNQGVYFMDSACVSQPQTCFSESTGPFPLRWPYAWHPQGRYLASLGSTPGEGIQIFDAKNMVTSGAIPNTGEIESANAIAWSSDGSKLALSLGTDLWIIDTKTGEDIQEHFDDKLVQVEFWLKVPPAK